ncbi:MFS transporter [Pseudonocardia alaniniphila]|uniref:MFS transporter n=1 Tax=Pseudonocardia alaniniphila TaxID=75291 RepID=A0ABS9T7N8_9PSEU|nr:MFS transporter [Pseudonocardia alaniniphila]MCH6164515.1 MFS transporter [Pseudonocardia alaniniphila]
MNGSRGTSVDTPGETEETTDDRARSRYAWRVLSVVCLASLMSGLNNSSLTIALPAIVSSFDASVFETTWILLAYQLTNVSLMVFFGRLADLFGRRPMYMTGVGLFTAASLLAGFAPSVGLLIACRVVQGIGTAMLITNSAALVTAAFPRRLLGQGLGIYMASFSLAQLLGPTLGGLLATEVGWQWTFWSNVPVGVVCLLWGLRVMERVPRRRQRLRIDPLGNLLVLVGLGTLLLALSQVGTSGWDDPLVLGCLTVFVLAVPAFLLVERRAAEPVVDLRTFRDPVVGIGTLAGFLATVSRFAVVLLMGLYFQAVSGDTPAEAGLKVLPIAVASIIAAPLAGALLRHIAPRTVAVAACAISLVGVTLLLFTISVDTPYPVLIGAVVVLGIGSGAFIPANSTAMLQDVPPDRLGITNAVRLMAQSSGVVISTAVALTLVAAPLPVALRPQLFDGSLSQVSPEALEDLVTGYRWAFGLMAVMSVLCLAASTVGRQVHAISRRAATTAPTR